MIEKNMKSRHVQKHATESEWLKANIFIPKQAEIIVYDSDDTHPYERFKIGDGVTLLEHLPFCEADLTGYATENWVCDQHFITETGLEAKDLPTKDWISDQNFMTEAGLGTKGYATENWVHQNFITESEANLNLELVTSDGYATYEGDINTIHQLFNSTYYGGIYDSYALRRELTAQGTTIKVPRIEVKTQEEYDALETKDETMIYIIKE